MILIFYNALHSTVFKGMHCQFLSIATLQLYHEMNELLRLKKVGKQNLSFKMCTFKKLSYFEEKTMYTE